MDCATSACSCAAVENGVLRAFFFEIAPHGQAERLTPMICDTLAACGWNHADIDSYVVTTGPGRFTGVRVGLATAKAMSLAAGKPLIGFSTLSTLAWPLFARDTPPPGPVVCCVESGRGDFYTQSFKKDQTRSGFSPDGTIMTRPGQKAGSWIPPNAWVAGEVNTAMRSALAGRQDVIFPPDPPDGKPTRGRPEARALAGLAQAEYAGQPLPGKMPRPLYVRDHYAAKSPRPHDPHQETP